VCVFNVLQKADGSTTRNKQKKIKCETINKLMTERDMSGPVLLDCLPTRV